MTICPAVFGTARRRDTLAVTARVQIAHMKTEFELDCPWCSGSMTIDADTSSDTAACATCSIVVDMAPEPITEHVALAA